MAALRAEHAACRAELDRLRAELAAPSGAAGPGSPRPAPRRRGPRPSPAARVGDAAAPRLSRRRLFGLLGGGAVVGTGLAVVGSALADPAAAGTGTMEYGTSNDAGSDETSLTSTNSTTTLSVANTNLTGDGIDGTSVNGVAVSGVSTNYFGVEGESTNGFGVRAASANSNSLAVEGPSPTSGGAHVLLSPGSVVGAPTGGGTLGQFWLDSQGALWQCVVAGSPGTWLCLTGGALVPVNPSVRVYDSRTPGAGGPLGGGATRSVTVSGGSTPIPAGISAVLCNLTCADPVGAGYLAMFEAGTSWSGTSNINFNNGQDVSNNVTCTVSSGGQVAVLCGGLQTDFVVDVFGLYP